MKVLFWLIFIILGPQAWAQTISCLPKNWGGSGSTAYNSESSPATKDSAGTWVGYACPPPAGSPAGSYNPNYFIALNGVSLTNPSAMLGLIPGVPSVDGVNKMLAVGSVAPLTTQQQIDYNHLAVAAKVYIANNLASQVTGNTAPKVCTVAVNGTAKTRQWYSYVNGVRSTSGGGSVNVGISCQSPLFTEGAVTYSTFGPSFRTDRVTVCTCQ